MYRANPRVNAELRQRLPSPAARQLSNSNRQLSNSTKQLSNSAQQLSISTQQFSNPTQQPSSPDRSEISPSLDATNWPQAPLSSPSPLSHRRSVSPVFHRRSVSPVSALSSRPSGGAWQMDNVTPIRGPSPRAESCGDVLDGGRASRGPGSPAPRRHLVPPEDSSHQGKASGPITASGRVQTLDGDKNVLFLLKELDALRDSNRKLQEELLQKEEELQRREVQEELREEQREARALERPAAVLDQILASQRDRDQALMSRLLLANEERDEALLRARRLQQAAESEDLPLKDTDQFVIDQNVEELLQSVCDADSAQEVQQFGSILVQRLQMARQRRNYITAQEMKAVMEERDGSIAKCKRLEQEVIQERERTRETEQLRLQRGRGGALEGRQRLEAELQVLRANHSSQDTLAAQATSPQVTPPQAPPLDQLQQLSKEKQSVEAELQRCQEAEREARERVNRLERLVEVLRKKVGTGSLRAVI
ncbi:mirror-image polydactyly gene 1 protein [Centropristis striata]|uniref:mirror-image polydactyly gene 1 protein n=1 Tax=Centropristis striata TaxID=184440 RepID=UPI0027DF50E6|nr:mirror-image polydactyly gene 1 protein [Centropristis striata]